MEQVEYVQGKARVIAINEAYKIAPWADVLYACDLKWWDWNNGAMDFKGLKVTIDEIAAPKYGLKFILGTGENGLSRSPDNLHTGMNSGVQAINLAYLFGATRILLLGYDMKIGDNGASHWHGDHPDGVRSTYRSWWPVYKRIAEQGLVEIINCSIDTALKCFPRKKIEDVL